MIKIWADWKGGMEGFMMGVGVKFMCVSCTFPFFKSTTAKPRRGWNSPQPRLDDKNALFYRVTFKALPQVRYLKFVILPTVIQTT
jgi:hypothetical protein